MSTNFYYHTDVCEHCKRTNSIHVGKQSAGWTFHFQAYRDQEDGSPDIISLADWARMFKTSPGILVNENEEVISDPMRWLAELERPTKEQQQEEDSRVRRFVPPNPETEWRDAEGFSFYDGDFC